MVIQLKKYSINVLPDAIKDMLSQYKYAFNPSYILHNQTNYFAIRLYDGDTKSIVAMLYIWKEDNNIDIIDLTKYFNDVANILKVSDPKFFILNDHVWGTFNTGYTEKNENILGVFQIQNSKIQQHYFCDYKERSRIEKNWSFYSVKDEIFVLYSLYPLTILKLTHFKNERAVFEDYHINKTVQYKNYTIGTQLTKVDNNYLFIAHKKIVKNGKRLYLGKAFALNIDKDIILKSNKKYLIHSLKSIFGAKKKFNKNLISCTYFSGIYVKKENAYLSYGINDVHWNTIAIKLKKIWE